MPHNFRIEYVAANVESTVSTNSRQELSAIYSGL